MLHKHAPVFIVILVALAAGFCLASWAGSLWGALGVLLAGFAYAFVMSLAWFWSPRSGVGHGRKPDDDSFWGFR